jgi:hypothetical protein
MNGTSTVPTNVGHGPDNTGGGCADGARYGQQCTKYFVRTPMYELPPWDVITFNYGLHDGQDSNSTYLTAIESIADQMIITARCAFSDRHLHSRMPLDPTHVRLKRSYMRVTNGTPLESSLLLPACTVNCVHTRRPRKQIQGGSRCVFEQHFSTGGCYRISRLLASSQHTCNPIEDDPTSY